MPNEDEVRRLVDEVESALWRDAELARQAPREPAREWRWLRCLECARESEQGRRWRACLSDFGPPSVGVYCPDCAAREFGPLFPN